MNEDNLKPCPSCGGEVSLVEFEVARGNHRYWVECNLSICNTHTEVYATKERAIEAWNKMADEKQEDLEFSDICRDLKHFPHGWWIAPMMVMEVLVFIIVLMFILQ